MARQLIVLMYGTKTCIWCAKTKEFFKEYNIKYKEIDVGASEKVANEMIKKSGQNSTPVIEISKEIIVGFNEDKLKRLLKIK